MVSIVYDFMHWPGVFFFFLLFFFFRRVAVKDLVSMWTLPNVFFWDWFSGYPPTTFASVQ